MDEDILRPRLLCIQFQRLGSSGEIPRVVYDGPRPWVGQFMRSCVLLCALCGFLLAIPRWTVGLFISPFELILVLFL